MDFETKPTSKKELLLYSIMFRVICGFNQTEPIDPVLLLDKLPGIKNFENVHYEIVDDYELDVEIPTQCDIINDEYIIKIKNSIYIGAVEKHIGGYRMHIMHEIMHVFADKLGFHPIHKRSVPHHNIPPYKSLEWIVKFLAGAVMIPNKGSFGMTENQIMNYYGVSQAAAKYSLRLKY